MKEITMAELTVRPAPNRSQKGSKDIFRVSLPPAYLVRYNLREGETYMLHRQDTPIGPAVVTKSPHKDLKTSVIQVSQFLQNLYFLKLGDKTSINPTPVELPYANTIVAIRKSESGQKQPSLDTHDEDKVHWAWLLKQYCIEAEIVAPGTEFSDVNVPEQHRAYKIVEVDSSRELRLYRMQSNCHVNIISFDNLVGKLTDSESTILSISKNDVGGLDEQLKELNEILSEYSSSKQRYMWLDGSPPRERGILLYGLPGTGKSLILRKVADAGWEGVFYLDRNAAGRTRTSEGSILIKNTFADALRSQPSVIIADNLESFASKQVHGEIGLLNNSGALLCQQIDQLHDARVLILGAVRSLVDIDDNIRHLDRFSKEMEISVPNSEARAQILKIMSGMPKDAEDEKLENIASRTHGFVGADLQKLHRMAGKKAKARVEASRPGVSDDTNSSDLELQVERMEIDYANALQQVRPTAIREVFVETPQVKWSDIAGQEKVKEYLEEAIIWPLKVGLIDSMYT